MFNHLATQGNESAEPLPRRGPPPDSESTEQAPVPETAYMPYAEQPARSEPYRPYGEKPDPNEQVYEPYKDI